jgi:aspartyl-tRNA(Asn)/glutamyl-tRNA(Gln) amidotransferase subunit C
MSLTTDDVKKIAKLARIKLNEEEVQKHQGELNKIFSWIQQLQEVNTDDVEPMFSVDDRNLKTREDVVTETSFKDEVLKNAPNAKYGYYVVPKVVE